VEKVIKPDTNGRKSRTVPIDSHFLVKDHRRGFAGSCSQLSLFEYSKTIAVDFSSTSMVEMFKNIRRVYDLHTNPMILSIPRDDPDGEAFPMNSIASV
jgi:hypothetical protein